MKPIIIKEGKPPTPSGKPPRASGTGTGTTQTPRPSSIPEFLGNVDGVKKFQDWLDKTHPGWATGYPNGVLNKAGGYGRFGPKTTAAWNSYGEEYKKSGTKLSTPEPEKTKTEEKSEEQKWFEENIKNGTFSGGSLIKAKTGQLAYKKAANLIDGDSEPIGQGFYYFFKNNTWRKYVNNAETDRGTYELADFIPDETNTQPEKKEMVEQIITSRKKQAVTTQQQAATPTGTQQAGTQTTTTQQQAGTQTNNQFLRNLGILDNPPDENRINSIYKGILSALKNGYQSNAFYTFKEGLKLLKQTYPDKYTDLDPNTITSMVKSDNFINYPIDEIGKDNSIDQLNDPTSQRSSFKQIPLKELIQSFPQGNTSESILVYIWPSVKSGIDTSTISTKIEDINDEKCLTALFQWYKNFLGKKPIDQSSTERTKKFLMACNNQCKLINKDETRFKRMFRTPQEKSADRIIVDLRSASAGEYRIPFADVTESCKKLGKEGRKLKMESTKNLKNMIKENLIVEKTKKQRLIKENKIIKNRLYVLVEASNGLKTQSDYNQLFESLISEANFLKEQGFNENLIQENWFNFLGKLGFGGFADTLQERLMAWILEKLNVPKDSYLSNLLITGFASFDLDNIGKILSGDCNTLVKWIAETIVNTVFRKKMSKTGETNYIEDLIRNSISDLLFRDKSELVKVVEDKLLSFVCPQLSKVSSKFSDVTGQLKQNLMGS
jgi:hypothetical protein